MTATTRSKIKLRRSREVMFLSAEEATLILDIIEDRTDPRLPHQIRKSRIDIIPLWCLKQGMREADWSLWPSSPSRAIPDRMGSLVQTALDLYIFDHVSTVELRNIMGEAAQGQGSCLRISGLDILKRFAGLIAPQPLGNHVVAPQLESRICEWRPLSTVPGYEVAVGEDGKLMPSKVRKIAA